MKICFYNVTASHKSGGLETYCWETGRALSKRGHEVTIVAGTGGSQRCTDVKLIQFPFQERSMFPKFGTRFQKLMERLSFGCYARRHLLEGGYDIIVINKPFDFPVMWWAKRKGLNTKVIFRSGGTDFFLGDRLFARAVDIWVSASHYNALQIKERYGHNPTVIHNGVDTDAFYPEKGHSEIKDKFGIHSESRLLMSVGRLVGWKGLHIIIDMLPSIESVHYIVVGDGPESSALHKRAEQLGVSNRVHFLGMVPHRDLPKLLRQADIFVQPSIGEEAFGISVVEAMACGVPVCASRNGGMTEIVIDGETGLLLPVGDTEAWRIAVQTLLKQPDRMREMGINARARAVQHFTWNANARQLENLFIKRNNLCAA
ncbi:glycosyltransferase family 4 protein [Dissulfurispira sp.]|uniref:glycosyltransferase family 4 protein n=1 Tax=Dissulfurispira sp. TaxID=2817609 RepID=UPI002FD88A73